MQYTLKDHFTAIAPVFSKTLLSNEHIHTVENLCSMFPFDTASNFGFETRLGKQEAVCDFFLLVKKEQAGSLIIGGKSAIARLSPTLLQNPFWIKITELFAAWTIASSILNERLEFFWLEFDSLESSFNLIPNMFFNINGKSESKKELWRSMLDVLNEIYRILFGIKFPAVLSENMKRCYEALPPNANIYQLGFMIPRKTEVVRLIISDLRDDLLFEYLKKIGWPGEISVIHKMITRYASKFDNTSFNLHIGETVLPFLGIEMYLKDMSQPLWDPRWNDIFDFLEAEKLLLPGKRKGLTTYSSKKTVSHLFPVHYFNLINHLKLVYKPGMPLECKGYFGTMINPQKEKTKQKTTILI